MKFSTLNKYFNLDHKVKEPHLSVEQFDALAKAYARDLYEGVAEKARTEVAMANNRAAISEQIAEAQINSLREMYTKMVTNLCSEIAELRTQVNK